MHLPFSLENGISPVYIIILLWSIVWKGLALWHAARRGDRTWYVALLFLNTIGLVEIAYLAFVARIWKFRKDTVRS